MRRNDQKLGDLLKAFSSDPKYKPKLTQKRVEEAWTAIAGEWISKETTSIRLYGRNLVIAVKSPALRQELHYSKEKVRSNVNEYLGEEYIDEVNIK